MRSTRTSAEISNEASSAQASMADPDTISDSSEFQRIAKQTSDLEQTVSAYREYMDVQQQLTEAKQMLKESEGKQVALCIRQDVSPMCT